MKIKPSKSFLSQKEILGGKGMIYVTPQSGGAWQFRTWIPEEQKYYRKSLKTKDEAEAISKAEQIYFDLQFQIREGHKVFGLTTSELVEQFLSEQEERVKTGRITKGRFGTIKTQLTRHYLGFVGDKTKLAEIDADKFFDYAQYRRKKNKEVEDVTIRNEQSTIGALYKFAFRKRFIPYEKPNFEEIRLREVPRRETFTFPEYEQLYRYMRKWIRDSNNPDEKITRQFIQDFILIKSNTFMRFGEIRQLKWGMVKILKRNGDQIAQIELPGEICKNRKSRTVIARGGEYFERVKRYSSYREKDDFVFVNNNTGSMIRRANYYKLWNELKEKAGLGEGSINKNLSYYSLRHFGITCRLYAEVPHYYVAKLAGTSVTFIERHYEHLHMVKLVESVTKSFRIDKEGWEIIENQEV